MAKKKKKPGGGLTGKPAMNEPRVQLFSMFGGCNFQLSPRSFDYVFEADAEERDEQTDLQQNFMVVQNNAHIAPNQTIETRQNLVTLFQAPTGKKFTGVATLAGSYMYAACSDITPAIPTLPHQSIHFGVLPIHGALGDLSSSVVLTDQSPQGSPPANRQWSFLGQADGLLVAMTSGLQLTIPGQPSGATSGPQIWTGAVGSLALKNAKTYSASTALQFSQLTPRGTLTLSAVYSAECPFMIELSYTIVTMFGPTMPSPTLAFYASKPSSEWTQTNCVDIWGGGINFELDTEVKAVELYFAEDGYKEQAFLARVDKFTQMQDGLNGARLFWGYRWAGYNLDTSSWAIANLQRPTQDYSKGVSASKMAVHDGQIYFWGRSPAYRIWVGGGPSARFSVSPGTGGGYLDCDPGTGAEVRSVLKFKTQQGAAIVTALCDNEHSSKESRFNLVETNISLSNEQSAKAWQAERVAGTVGCKSFHGAVVANDGLYAVSRYGLAMTTHAMENSSQLTVEYVSDPIEPVFLKPYGEQLKSSVLFTVNDILYMTFGWDDSDLDNVIFCYDTDLKAWWTYTLDIDKPILNMIHIDHEGHREGIGIITEDAVYLLPTTRGDAIETIPTHDILIESGELSSMQPLQALHHLSQLEFRFDYFIGELDIVVTMIDQFGRTIETRKRVSHATLQHHLSEYMRIDAVVESYKVALMGKANMRLTHFLSKSYPKSNRVGMVWGFDSQQSHTSPGSIHRTFSDYNDLKEAIIP